MRKFLSTAAFFCCAFLAGTITQSMGDAIPSLLTSIGSALSITGRLSIFGDNATITNSPIFENIAVTGKATGRPQGINYLHIADSVDTSYLLSGLYLRHNYGGGSSAGNRFGIFSYFSVDSMPNSSDTSIQNYTALTAQSSAKTSTKSGLTGGVNYSGYHGSLWASDDNVWLARGATNWSYLVGHEIGYAVYAGASVADRWGLAIYAAGDMAGNIDDAGILLARSDSTSSSAAMKNGIEFGGVRHNWPVAPTGSIITATARSQGRLDNPIALYGVDLSSVTFSKGGAPYLAPLITPVRSFDTCKKGGIEWDENYIYVCTKSNTWKRVALSTF